MNILFFSDIHGIVDNLDVIERKIKEHNIVKLVCLGDLYYNYSYSHESDPDKVLEFLSKHKDILICMRGNCDRDIDKDTSPFPIFDDYLSFKVDDVDVYITHGNKLNMETNTFIDKGVLIYGHEHIPYIENKGNVTYINTGSISLPKGGSNPSYLIYKNREYILYDIYDNVIDKISL